MMKFLPSILSALVALSGVASPQLQEVVSAHPALVLCLGAVYGILKHMLPSPLAQSEKSE